MALDPNRLGSNISILIQSAMQPDPSGQTDKFGLAIATAIIAELLANAVVIPTALVAPPSGGPVTGQGSVT